MRLIPLLMVLCLLLPALGRADDGGGVDPFLQPAEPDPELEADLDRMDKRRRILKWHQGFALTTLGLLVGQVAIGQVLINRQRQSLIDDSYETLKWTHLGLGLTAFSTYWTAAGLAIGAPEVDREDATDSLTLHKSLAWAHGAGMAITPILGLYTSQQRTAENPTLNGDQLGRLQTAHQAIGYATTGLLAGAALVIVFDIP